MQAAQKLMEIAQQKLKLNKLSADAGEQPKNEDDDVVDAEFEEEDKNNFSSL